jgi:hypothetical protein
LKSGVGSICAIVRVKRVKTHWANLKRSFFPFLDRTSSYTQSNLCIFRVQVLIRLIRHSHPCNLLCCYFDNIITVLFTFNFNFHRRCRYILDSSISYLKNHYRSWNVIRNWFSHQVMVLVHNKSIYYHS